MGLFQNVLKASIPTMISNPIAATIAMGLAVVRGKKVKSAVKGKNAMAFPQNIYELLQSPYGAYIRGMTTIGASYIGHPAVMVPMSEMLKKMMEEAAPPVNRPFVTITTEQMEALKIEEREGSIKQYIKEAAIYLQGHLEIVEKVWRGERVIDEKYTLENLFNGNLTIDDIPDPPELINMIVAIKTAELKGFYNGATSTLDAVETLLTQPGEVCEAVVESVSDFAEHPWQNTKELVGGIFQDTIDLVWRSTPQEIAEKEGELAFDLISSYATGGGAKIAGTGIKAAGSGVKTAVKEAVPDMGTLVRRGMLTADNVPTGNIANGITNAPYKMMVPDEKKVANTAKRQGGEAAKTTAKTGETTGRTASKEALENIAMGAPVVQEVKKAGEAVQKEATQKTAARGSRKTAQEGAEKAGTRSAKNANAVKNKVVREASGKTGKGVQTSGAVNETNIDDITPTTNTAAREAVQAVTTVPYGQHFETVDRQKRLKKNVKYVDANGYAYITDSQGRIVNVEGSLILKKGKRNLWAQRKVGGKDRLDIDHGGHLIGTQFNGSGDIDNLLPQNRVVNQPGGEWYEMERKWATALRNESSVEVKINVIYEGTSTRPTRYFVTYKIDGKETIERIENYDFLPEKSS